MKIWKSDLQGLLEEIPPSSPEREANRKTLDEIKAHLDALGRSLPRWDHQRHPNWRDAMTGRYLSYSGLLTNNGHFNREVQS
jgi:hypothetical protein